ncbi:helix-turn-helix domain-containing protein [Streptomyces globisporus]|uniref:helix-turn-helix domain-containing protein n=1 Tax=Streptomyces globisporus TaxID=1908 RepID=UPI0038267FEE
MGGSQEVPAAAAAYAAALREVVDGFRAVGGTQKRLADALHVSQATLSRYLSGERIAPYDFLRDLRVFLDGKGLLWDQDMEELLDTLCGQAHAASGSPAVQLVQIREELARLREGREEQQQEKQFADVRLAVLEAQVRELSGQLAQALHHARTTEGARALLQEQVYAQDESLRHAQDYIHQVEAELSEQREQARLLQLEVGVLRKQNQRFVEEQAHTISGVSTQATGFDAALAARAAGQATEAARQTATPQESTSARPRPDGMSPGPYRPSPPDPVPVGEIRPGRDTLAFLVLAAAAWTAGAVFAAGIRADPGPSVWKLIIAAVVVLLVAAVSWVGYLFVMEKYDPSLDSGPAVFTVPALLVVGVGVPLLRDTDDPVSYWVADVAGLL